MSEKRVNTCANGNSRVQREGKIIYISSRRHDVPHTPSKQDQDFVVSFIYNTRLYAPFKWFGIALFSQISIKKNPSNSSIPVSELRASRVQVIQRWSDLQNQIWEDKSDESHINEKQKSGGATTVWADLLKTARSSLWLYSHCGFWDESIKTIHQHLSLRILPELGYTFTMPFLWNLIYINMTWNKSKQEP